jgi:hypothetical protein
MAYRTSISVELMALSMYISTIVKPKGHLGSQKVSNFVPKIAGKK